MIRQNLLPILRKWKIWLAVFLAAAAFTVSGAWLSREVARNQAEIDQTWEEMTVNFRLGPGRKSLSSTFTLKFAQVRKLIELDCYESFDLEMTVPKGCAFVSNRHPVVDLENGTVENPPPESLVSCSLIWAVNPGDKYGPIPKWGRGREMAISPALAERFGAKAGGRLTMYSRNIFRFTDVTITAVNAEIPDDVILVSPELFSFFSVNEQSESGYSASVLTFTLKKEENKNTAAIYDKIQKIVNTPSPYDRNKFVSVYYNEGEIDGVMGPLQNAQRSAVFFEKLFRTVLPFVVYALELIAVLGLANECGVRRLLGDGAGAVFFGIWLPAAFFVLISYLIPSLAVLAAGLGPYASWTTAALHAAASLVLTAAVTGLFCLLTPLNLLKERNDEQ